MPCPTCGSEETIPLTLKKFDNFAGAARVCEDCQAVYLIANDAFLPKPLRNKQILDWAAVRAVLQESIAAICRHPVLRDHLAQPDVESDIFRRDAMELVETAVAAVAPILKQTDEG